MVSDSKGIEAGTRVSLSDEDVVVVPRKEIKGLALNFSSINVIHY